MANEMPSAFAGTEPDWINQGFTVNALAAASSELTCKAGTLPYDLNP
jgi:hypothetical protein